ncbi:MAG: AI-2E family transporter [Armatimonadota bacterium]|nr:AI-2E family transporter [Armatimonadota bacterium]
MADRRELLISAVVVTLAVALTLGFFWILIQIWGILLLVLLSAILAAGVAPLVAQLERLRLGRRHLSRLGALLVVYLGIVILVLLLSSLLVTPLALEAQSLVQSLPTYLEELRVLASTWQARYPWFPDLTNVIDRLPRDLAGFSRYFAPAAGFLLRFLGNIVSAITVLVLSFYMILESAALKQGFLFIFPPTVRGRVEGVLARIGEKFSSWLRGQLLLAAIIFVMDAVGLALLGMPYPVLLGVVAGITELIPVIGPVLGAIPGVLIALFQPLWRLLAVIALYTAVQQIEGNFLVPRVMRRAVGLSPILTILALLIGARLAGILGAFIAIPVAAALQVIAGEILGALRSDASEE